MAQRRFLIDGGFEVNNDSAITGNLEMTGHIIPTVDSNGVTGYDLGSPTAKWRDLYLSEGSLYINNQKVIEDNSGTIVVRADADQSLTVKTEGTGVLTLQSAQTVNFAGTLQMAAGKRITSADGLAVVFGDKIDVDGNRVVNVSAPVGDLDAANKAYVDGKFDDIINGAPAALDTLNELANALGDDANFASTVTTSLATKATITYVDAQVAQAVINANNTSSATTDALDLRLDAVESTNASQATQLATNAAAIASNAADIAANSQAVIDAQAAAATDATTKANAALATANAYTDTREAAITSAYTSAIAVAAAAQDELSELADVSMGTLANNQVLKYNSALGVWQNAVLSTAQIAEGANLFFTEARVRDVLTTDSMVDETQLSAGVQSAKDYTDARETDIVAAYTSADSALSASIDAEQTARIAGDSALDSRLTTAESDIDALEASVANIISNVDPAALDSLTEVVAAFQAADGTLNSAITTLADDASAARSALEVSLQAYADTAEADAITSANAYTDGRETAITTAYTSAIATSKAASDAYADQAEADAVSTAAADATSKANAALVDAKDYTDARETAITTAYQSYADTAEADAISSANSYTDGRETAITTAYQSYADAAEADAITSANSYTDARETAITTAYQSYADAAEADAVSTAAADATSKASAAETAAKTYADGIVSSEATVRSSADTTLQSNIDTEATTRATADTALANDLTAKIGDATVDGTSGNTINDRIATALSSAQTYADTAEADAITSANAYTDARETAITTAYTSAIATSKAASDAYADQAEVDAKAYADGIVSSEASARQSADTGLQNDLSTETAARISGDAALQAQIDQNASDIGDIEVDLPANYVAKTSVQALHATDALRFGANTLSLYKGDGTYETVDLSLYVDDTNLARIISGTMASNGIATFTRDDNTSFTVDMSILLDDTNLSRIVSAAWNTGNGVLTLTRNDATTVTVDLDDRYSLTSHNHTLDSLSNVSISGNTNGEILRWNGSDWVNNTLAEAGISATHSHPYLSDTHDMSLTLSGDASGTVTFTNMGDATLTVTIADDSHNHVISNIDGLQSALDAKADDTTTFTAGAGLTGGGTLATNRTFNVGAGTGIVVTADAVSVDTAYTDNRYVQPADLVNFHSAAQTVTSAQSATNVSSTVAFTFADLSTAKHYSVYLNRMLLRPTTEYTVSGSTVTFVAGVLATDDEIEVTGLKLV